VHWTYVSPTRLIHRPDKQAGRGAENGGKDKASAPGESPTIRKPRRGDRNQDHLRLPNGFAFDGSRPGKSVVASCGIESGGHRSRPNAVHIDPGHLILEDQSEVRLEG
jgi:hypothetical protein